MSHRQTLRHLSVEHLESRRLLSVTQPGTLNRPADPVVITGADISSMIGMAPGDLVAFRDTGSGWQQVPIQVDERDLVTMYQIYGQPIPNYPDLTILTYTDANTFTGPDSNSTLDANDEIVFMSKDTGGGRVPGSQAAPADVLASSRIELRVSDPVDAGQTGWIYLFQRSSSALTPGAGVSYVDYQFRLLVGNGDYKTNYNRLNGPNPENSTIDTAYYGRRFTERWVTDELRIKSGNSADLLDRHKFQFKPGDGTRTEDVFSAGEGAFIINKSGPVRALRSWVGAMSGPYTQREEIYYEQRQDVNTYLRVHEIVGAMDLFDYNSAANGMIYRNNLNLAGVVVNGSPDTVVTGSLQWELITGSQGSLSQSHVLDTNLPGYTFTSYYLDNTNPPRSDRQVSGDSQAWGQSGPWLQNLASTDAAKGSPYYLQSKRVMYYSAPGATVATAQRNDSLVRNPLQVAAMPHAGGPYTVAEGGSVSFVGSATGSNLTYSWDVNGDNNFGDATGPNPTLTWSQLQSLGINDGPSTRQVRLRVTGGTFSPLDSSAVTLTITNTAPTAGISAQSAAVRGESINFAFTATDPSSVDQAASFTYAIDWNNDGITDLTQVGGSTLNVSYAYTAIGNYTARVRVTDKDGGVSAWASRNINVTRSRTAPNPNNGSLTDLHYGGSMGDDFIIAGAGNIYDPMAGPNSIFVVNFNTADPIELFPTVTGRIIVYLQDGDDVFNTVSVTLPTVQYGGNGADVLFGTTASDTLDGGAGDDWIFGSLDRSTSPDLIFGGDGTDIILADGGNDTIDGGNGNDVIVGNDGNDSILGGSGDDFILAGAGADIIFGGAGSDLIIAGQYDPNQDLDGSVLDEWWSGDTYSNRVNHLLGNLAGGLNTQNLIAGNNVLNDSSVDTVYGQADQDFFFIDLQQDIATDIVFGEAVVDL